MKVLRIIEYRPNIHDKHQVQLPLFLSQFLVFFNIGYYIGIVPFKLKFNNKSGSITVRTTIINKVWLLVNF